MKPKPKMLRHLSVDAEVCSRHVSRTWGAPFPFPQKSGLLTTETLQIFINLISMFTYDTNKIHRVLKLKIFCVSYHVDRDELRGGPPLLSSL